MHKIKISNDSGKVTMIVSSEETLLSGAQYCVTRARHCFQSEDTVLKPFICHNIDNSERLEALIAVCAERDELARAMTNMEYAHGALGELANSALKFELGMLIGTASLNLERLSNRLTSLCTDFIRLELLKQF